MPRATQKPKEKAQKKAELKELVVPGVETEEEEPLFPLVVKTFLGKLPGQEGYEASKDLMLTGFQYGGSMLPTWAKTQKIQDGVTERLVAIKDLTPYDFLTSPATGMRLNETTAPKGLSYNDLSKQVSDYTPLPPAFVWHKGKWLSDLLWEFEFDINLLPSWLKSKADSALKDWPAHGIPPDLYHYWVTSGEGTYGNYEYRLYELPKEIAGENQPKHPRHWPDRLRKGTSGSSYDNWGANKSATTTSKPKVPAGVRVRCADCGHWFAFDDLVGHSQVCGKGEDADWAMMCHSDCGCVNLDEACTPKPGFPRKKPVTSNGGVKNDAEAVGVGTEGSGSSES